MARNSVRGSGFHHVAMILSTLCAFAPAAAAQNAAPLGKGARVRVVIPAADGQPERYVAGSLVRLEGDTVVLASGGLALAGVQTVALGRGRRLEVLASSHGHGGKGAVLGAAFGALAGVVVGAATWQPCPQQGGFACIVYPSQGTQMAGGAILGAAGGALVGLVIGASIRDARWVPLETAGVRVAVAAGAVGISVAF